MNKAASQYLKTIDMPEPFIKRIRLLWERYQELCPEPFSSVFVTDARAEEGQRLFQNIWFFSQNYVMESANFIANDNVDMVRFANKINRWDVSFANFDLGSEATDAARLHVAFTTSDGNGGSLQATGQNCVALMAVVRLLAANVA
jgi:hypothetical protein